MRMAMKVKIVALIAVLLIPAVSSATHITALDFTSDCNGWSADVTVRFRSTIYEFDADYTVTLVDSEGAEMEVQNWAGTLSREDGAYVVQSFQYGDDWSVNAPPGDYTVVISFHIYSPWDGGVDEETWEVDDSFTCTVVPVEAHTFSSVKSLYR